MTRRKAVWVRILVCVCFLSGFFCFVFENFVLDELQSSGASFSSFLFCPLFCTNLTRLLNLIKPYEKSHKQTSLYRARESPVAGVILEQTNMWVCTHT